MATAPASGLLFGDALDQQFRGDKELQQLLKASSRTEPSDDVLTRMDEIFEEEFLVFLLDEFDQARPYLAKHLLSTQRPSRKKTRIKELKWPPGDPTKKYFWLCKTCGENKGIHYYPIQKCCTCGKRSQLVRKMTKSPMGYVYRADRIDLSAGSE